MKVLGNNVDLRNVPQLLTLGKYKVSERNVRGNNNNNPWFEQISKLKYKQALDWVKNSDSALNAFAFSRMCLGDRVELMVAEGPPPAAD